MTDEVHPAGLTELLVQRLTDFSDDALDAGGTPATALEKGEDVLDIYPDPSHPAP
jgi:hypothetical protein